MPEPHLCPHQYWEFAELSEPGVVTGPAPTGPGWRVGIFWYRQVQPMSYDGALQAMRGGARMRRRAWCELEPHSYLYCDLDQQLLRGDAQPWYWGVRIPNQYRMVPYQPGPGDQAACDWEPYQP
jgi:hypothetical protein